MVKYTARPLESPVPPAPREEDGVLAGDDPAVTVLHGPVLQALPLVLHLVREVVRPATPRHADHKAGEEGHS